MSPVVPDPYLTEWTVHRYYEEYIYHTVIDYFSPPVECQHVALYTENVEALQLSEVSVYGKYMCQHGGLQR